MKICVVGKYPPIEGGVSTHTYWLVRGLAERGHHVHVVTNADEVEDTYRLTLDAADGDWYQPEFVQSGGRVRVYNTQPFSERSMSHIPSANPFVSKLASVATDIVRRHVCDVIVAYYYEPYAVAGWLASTWTGCPLIIKHAGSDLDRLFRVPDLATTYKEVLRSAHLVMTQPGLMARFIGLGVDERRLSPDIPFAIAKAVFSSDAGPIELDRLAIRAQSPCDPTPRGGSGASQAVIGTYGKIGISKGTFDLIAALGTLARKDIDFRFAAMIGSAQSRHITAAIQRSGIEDRTDVLPMVPNWRVPGFLRACTAVCFLERDFPVAIHGPIIPREVFACGTCLVLSGEIASKQKYRDRLDSGKNVLVVDDPRDHAALAATLRSVIMAPTWARAIGEQGEQLSHSLEDYQAFLTGWDDVLARCVNAARLASPTTARPQPEIAIGMGFESVIPNLVAFLRRSCPSMVETFVPSSAARTRFEAAIEFCDFAANHSDLRGFGAELPKLLAVLTYAKMRLTAAYDSRPEAAVFAVGDCLHGSRVSRESAWTLRPIRGNSLRMAEFDYDLSALSILPAIAGYQPAEEDGTDLAALERTPTVVLFHQSANLIPCELRIDEATRELVNRCDGTLTTAGLIDEMYGYFGAERSEFRGEVATKVCNALDYLYQKGVLVFGEYRDGWGWIGGARDKIELAAQRPVARSEWSHPEQQSSGSSRHPA